MKLSRFLMIALLAGTLGVIGCSDDPAPPAATGGTGGNGTGGTGGTAGNGGMGGTAGNGGMGGTPAGNCDYGDCAEPGTERDACETAVDVCLATTPDGSELERVCVEGANTDACGPR